MNDDLKPIILTESLLAALETAWDVLQCEGFDAEAEAIHQALHAAGVDRDVLE